MIKTKKAICVLLSVILLAGMFAFSGFAAEQNAVFTVTPSATQVAMGETVTVTVSATTDYYAATTAVPVYYDAALFDLVPDSVVAADIFGAGATRTAINTAEDGKVSVSFTPDSRNTQNIIPTAQILNNTTLFTFQLTAKATGISSIALKAEDQKTETNAAGTLYCGAYASSDITSAVTMVGQNFTFANAEITVGVPELVVVDGTTGAIDTVNKYVYGVTPGDAATNYFTATNGGTVKMIANDAGVDNGTGAILQLIAADGTTVLDTYTLIIFGDVNGDATVDSTDSFIVMQKVSGMTALAEIQAFAGDLNADLACDSTDSFIIMQKVSGAADITVNPYA